MRSALVGIVAVVAGCGSPAPVTSPPRPGPGPADAPIAPADLAADVALLREVYEALHPGLDRYTTRAQRDRAYDAILAEAGAAPTLATTYLALTRFTATLRCGHSFPNPFNQSDAVQAALFAAPVVPFEFRWIGGEMVVTRGLGDAPLAPGTAITAIDGHPTGEVLRELLPLARADGSNDAKRIATLEVRGDERFQAFDLLYPLLWPRAPGPYRLDVRDPDGATRTIDVAAQPPRGGATRHEDPAAAAWELTFFDDGVGYLRMPTWALYDGTWDWQAAIERDVATLVTRRAPGLIVDLRGNEGGLDVGDALLRHLIAAPLARGGLVRRVRYRAVPAALRPPLDTWDPSFFDWGDDATPRGDGWFALAGEVDQPLLPAAPRFTAPVVVLVDAANSSATFQFAQLVQRHRLATLIGEPTGGNQRGINGGAFFFVRLPRTGLEVDLPLIGRFPADGDDAVLPDAGIVPEVRAPITAADLARGHDAALAAARARLQR